MTCTDIHPLPPAMRTPCKFAAGGDEEALPELDDEAVRVLVESGLCAALGMTTSSAGDQT